MNHTGRNPRSETQDLLQSSRLSEWGHTVSDEGGDESNSLKSPLLVQIRRKTKLNGLLLVKTVKE
jgi:hypothetical protein